MMAWSSGVFACTPRRAAMRESRPDFGSLLVTIVSPHETGLAPATTFPGNTPRAHAMRDVSNPWVIWVPEEATCRVAFIEAGGVTSHFLNASRGARRFVLLASSSV